MVELQRHRREMSIEPPSKQRQSSVGAACILDLRSPVAPTELSCLFRGCPINMSRLRRWKRLFLQSPTAGARTGSLALRASAHSCGGPHELLSAAGPRVLMRLPRVNGKQIRHAFKTNDLAIPERRLVEFRANTQHRTGDPENHSPPTPTAFPRPEGFAACSTDAKNASAARCIIIGGGGRPPTTWPAPRPKVFRRAS